MLDDLYNQRILELAADIPRLGRLDAPMASATARSKLCGSQVTVDIILKDGKVVDFSHDVKACALGQASSSIMARHVIGATHAEVLRGRDQLRLMLKDNGEPPEGRWSDLAILEPVRAFKARHASILLTFDAVIEAIEQAERRVAMGSPG